jgi:hypothetical protein
MGVSGNGRKGSGFRVQGSGMTASLLTSNSLMTSSGTTVGAKDGGVGFRLDSETEFPPLEEVDSLSARTFNLPPLTLLKILTDGSGKGLFPEQDGRRR